MTLTLPTPDAGDTARQRFALELLLQQPVPGLDQLLASRNLLNDALPEVGPDQWRALQAMPIAIGADQLDIAIPSQWRDQEWQHLIDQLPDQRAPASRSLSIHFSPNETIRASTSPPWRTRSNTPCRASPSAR